MLLAIDDTDGSEGGCTTYLMTKIISEAKLDVIGFPRLVRLNPNVPYKTRGNAALCVELRQGSGAGTKIGEFAGKPIFSFRTGEEPKDQTAILDHAWRILENEAKIDDVRTNPGMIAASVKPPQDFYFKTLRELVPLDATKRALHSLPLSYRYAKNGRGLTGALAALSWKPVKHTYELLAYNAPRARAVDRATRVNVARMADNVSGTFNNLDPGSRHASIFPAPNTPIQYGIRSLKSVGLSSLPDRIRSEFNVGYDAYLVYETNQATDEHNISNPDRLRDLRSYDLCAVVASMPECISGGHWFFDIRYNAMIAKVAVFEPTKSMRSLFREICVGDRLRIWASFKKGALNMEKAVIAGRSRVFRRTPPDCDKCGNLMVNRGTHDFRCHECGSRKDTPKYVELERDVQIRSYEAPVAERRHLVAAVTTEECLST